jgi:predicted nucleic acid-binding protein
MPRSRKSPSDTSNFPAVENAPADGVNTRSTGYACESRGVGSRRAAISGERCSLAASCLESGVTLITRDRDFARFKSHLRGWRFVPPWPEVSQ